MKALEKESLNNLTRIMESIASAYFNAKRFKDYEPKMHDIENDDYENRYTVYIKRVEQTYMALEPLEQVFINNDFFFEAYPDWWVGTYSKRSYLFYKRKTLIHFLRKFYYET